jgi:acetyl-CoA carboxylase biotin carboxylase subunit
VADEQLMAFAKILIANRGAIAARILRAIRALGRASVCVYSEADAGLPYLAKAGESRCIGPGPARESYLNIDALLAAARESGADAIHPGYGFLSENAEFARRVRAAGIAFIGPNPDVIDAMGHKTNARTLVAKYGMPLGKSAPATLEGAESIGFPVLVKPASGGGGIGMIAARSAQELLPALERAQSMAQRAFGDAEIYLERLAERPRHVEIQIVADQHGNATHLFERDCSVQRRHQKLIEESPAPGIARDAIASVAASAVHVMEKIGYDNIGTVEMLRDADGNFQFLEMNTRLQVEHGVTEAVTGVDLVTTQIQLAEGAQLRSLLPMQIALNGHAIEARVYAEDPVRFLPSPGTLSVFRLPSDASIRVDTGYEQGSTITPFYDPLVAKVIVHAATRDEAREKLATALGEFEIAGIKHNIPALVKVLRSDAFANGAVHTGLVGV